MRFERSMLTGFINIDAGMADVASSMKIASETLREDIPRIIAEANQQVLRQAA
jgi:hypothetical protein